MMNKKKRNNSIEGLTSFAPPGVKGELGILLVSKDEKRSDQDIFQDKRLRRFIIKAQLSKNSYVAANSIKASINENEGKSFLIVPPHILYSKVQSPHGEFVFIHNNSNELSCIKFSCTACSPQEAKSFFHEAVMPFIDNISYKSNCPIHVPLISCEDVDNRFSTINYTSPYKKVRLNPHESRFNERMIPVYALFREAKNTDSSYYKFLCFYKILEGIYKHLRPELFKKAKEHNIDVQGQKELVPDHPELQRFHPEYVGKPIKTFFDNEFQKEFRDSIAHFLLHDGSVLNISDYSINSKFTNVLLVIELCCRTVIDTQENYYQQYENQL